MKMYNAAKYLLSKDVQVVPLNDNKKPTVSFKNVTIDDEFIDNNFLAYANTNVLGVLTRGLWCIDIDINHVNGESGFDSLKDIPYYDEFVSNAQTTLVQTTASGGKHVIFKKRDGVEYAQKIGYLPSVDIKAHDNNYFVLAGSKTAKGLYTSNKKPVIAYDGEFEARIFSKRGNYLQQTMEKFSVKSVLPNHNFNHLQHTGKGGLGKEAYNRVINGESVERNNDVYKAISYALQCNVDIEPLKVIIGDVKANGDVYTLDEWEKSYNSARNSLRI